MLFAAYTYTKLLCQPYDVLVAPSAAGREAVEAILGVTSNLTAKSQPVDTVSMPSPQLVNIPLGVDENRFIARDRELARKQFDIPDTAIVILYLGRITEHFKADLEPLLLATSKLVREMPEVCLVLSGQDTQQVYSRMLSELGTVNGISENLRIIPNIAPRLKPFLYSAADIFVSPVDNIQETFGLALLEAMASGLPVVASDWSGYRDIIEDGKEGFLIPTYWNSPVAKIASHFATMMSMSNEYYLAQRTIVDTNLLYDRLRLLAASPELRRECGALGKARVEKLFAWRLVIEKFRNLWLQQLEEFRAAPNPFTSPDHVCFDHDAIFRRYASQSLTVDCRIAADKNLPGGAELLRNRLGYMLNPSLIDAIEMIFEKCSAPQTVGELLKDSDRITAEAVLWLLKKGFCHLLPAF
jgi:glycosyltransferase involved in cell wall biosynthesis